MLTASYRPRARTVWIPLRTSIEICRLGEGHSLCPWECRLFVGKPFPRRPRKCCQLETRASWQCLLQCTCSSNQSVPSQNRAPRDLKPNICISDFHFCEERKRKRKRSDSVLWQKPLHQQKVQKGKVTTQTTPQKSSIEQRLRTDLGRSVGVTTATQLVWLTGLRAHLPTNRNSRLIKRTHV